MKTEETKTEKPGAELEKVSQGFIADFCGKNQIQTPPEVELNIKGPASHHMTAQASTGRIAPTGNAMGMLLDIEINFNIGKASERKNVYYAIVEWNYNHPNGGSNGYSTRYMILTESHFVERRYEGYVRAGLVHQIRKAFETEE